MKKENSRQRVYLYQWINFRADYNNPAKLGRFGGNGRTADKFRGIEDDLKQHPSASHWIVAARRDEGEWGVFAILKLRLPSDSEKPTLGTVQEFGKYLYFDDTDSGFLVNPNLKEKGKFIEAIDMAIKKKIPEKQQTQGRNGIPIDIDEHEVARLLDQITESLKNRKLTLQSESRKQARGFEPSSTEKPNNARPPDAEIETAAQFPEATLPTSTIPLCEQAVLESETQSLRTEERNAVVKIRYGQGAFRDALLAINGDRCWMSEIEGKQLLVASHIKPWSQCQNDTDARGQPDNGLLLSALWDSVFDGGLICFNSDFKVIASSTLSESAKSALRLSDHQTLHERFRNSRRREYLAYHRENVFECWM